jgi:hypothetical protein
MLNEHDDLVFAVALAWWKARERQRPLVWGTGGCCEQYY